MGALVSQLTLRSAMEVLRQRGASAQLRGLQRGRDGDNGKENGNCYSIMGIY